MATAKVHFDHGYQQLTDVDPDTAADIARTIAAGHPDTFELVGLGNGVTSRHLTADVTRFEIEP